MLSMSHPQTTIVLCVNIRVFVKYTEQTEMDRHQNAAVVAVGSRLRLLLWGLHSNNNTSPFCTSYLSSRH